MSDETQKALPSTPSILSVDPPPENDLRWRRMVRARNCLIGFWIGGIVTEVVAFPLISVPAMKDYFLPAMGVLTVTWLGGGCVAMLVQSRLEKHMQQRFQSKDAANLGCCIDILFAPAAVAVHGVSASKFYAEARTAVLEQLPGLTEETVLLVRDSERRVLYSTLKGKDAELIPVVLRAIPIFCDARSLPFIRHLADGKGLAATNADLQSEAQVSLSRLQSVLDLTSGSQGLLRASYAPQLPEEQLLKPVQGNRETDPRELLRPDVQKE